MTQQPTQQERALVHQVHPAKLATDISASVVSSWLFWHQRLLAGLLVHYVSPVLGSALVLRFADVDRLADTKAGKYVLRHMPPPMVALRLAGDTITAIGAWRRRPAYICAGLMLVAVGWSHGVLRNVED